MRVFALPLLLAMLAGCNVSSESQDNTDYNQGKTLPLGTWASPCQLRQFDGEVLETFWSMSSYTFLADSARYQITTYTDESCSKELQTNHSYSALNDYEFVAHVDTSNNIQVGRYKLTHTSDQGAMSVFDAGFYFDGDKLYFAREDEGTYYIDYSMQYTNVEL
ncbi:hypothetical protein [Motilimonas eburnea]|uniref:hypothetical protein n=1 Tax=Motilimonas eburnea TaxID=1737488 RepID=UPI001E46057F|nr:hypothetical protein [Motilimonas eburnea]MCE2573891.1 hypothetical protein [Motilimonas eburnea]